MKYRVIETDNGHFVIQKYVKHKYYNFEHYKWESLGLCPDQTTLVHKEGRFSLFPTKERAIEVLNNYVKKLRKEKKERERIEKEAYYVNV